MRTAICLQYAIHAVPDGTYDPLAKLADLYISYLHRPGSEATPALRADGWHASR